MKTIACAALLGVLASFSGTAFAKADCKAYPKAEDEAKPMPSRRSRRRATPSTSSRCRGQLLRDLRQEQGRQEGRDLLRRQDPRAGEERDREVAPCLTPAPGSQLATAASPCGTRPFVSCMGRSRAWCCSTLVVRRRRPGASRGRLRGRGRGCGFGSFWAAVARGEGRGFAALKPSVANTLAYVRSGAPRTVGHDPLGVWMVWLLWTPVLLLGVSGGISRLDAFWGDLIACTRCTRCSPTSCSSRCPLHLAGVGCDELVVARESAPRAMLTGESARTTAPP